MNRIRLLAGRALWLMLGVIPLIGPASAGAQGTLDDYRRAAAVTQRLANLTVNVAQLPTWVSPTRFWYGKSTRDGTEFVMVDATTGEKTPAPATMTGAVGGNSPGASAIRPGGVTGAPPTPSTACLPPPASASTDESTNGRGRGAGRGGGGQGAFGRGGASVSMQTGCISPDGQSIAFIQNFNVAVRPVVSTGRAQPGIAGSGGRPAFTMLTYDGSDGDEYQLMSIRWAPDSKKLVAYRRRPGYTRLVHYVLSSPIDQLQPKDTSIFYRKPGDVLDFVQPVLLDVESRSATVVENALFPNAYQISQAAWRTDSHAFTFEYNQRGHQAYRVIEVDAATGAPRVLVSEEPKTFFSYRPLNGNPTDHGSNWRFDVDDGKEIIWMSERDGWAHLYLYDGTTGRVKNQITKGDWVVRGVDSVDVANRQIYFRASGMNPGQDPYFIHYYRINFDGTGLVKYTDANGDHRIVWSPDHRYYVDMYSRVDLPTVLELRRTSDMRVTPLEKGDMSAQVAAGWRPPQVFVAKGRDGTTDIWGIIVRPTAFDPTKKYPVIEQIYAGPQGNFVPKTWGGGLALQPLAELGFVVVQIDGMGTNNRSKAFHDVAWKNLGDAGFPDRILWHKAMAAKYPWYDITRVGLYGTSAGGQSAMGGLVFHPEFYRVAYANSGCHDNRMDKIWWNEQWMGWPLGPQYEASSNVVNASKLQGHLMLVIGEFDTNVDPSSGYQVVNALIQAGKYFDLLVVPNGGHGAGGQYAVRKRNDFFVHWLLGGQPPDWNQGITDAAVGSGVGVGLVDSDDQLGPSFYDGPDDPPYVWW